MSSSYLPQKVHVEKFREETDEMIARQRFNDSLIGKLCQSNIPSLTTGILLESLFAVFTKVCGSLTREAGGKSYVKLAGAIRFIVGYAPVSIVQFLIVQKFGIK